MFFFSTTWKGHYKNGRGWKDGSHTGITTDPHSGPMWQGVARPLKHSTGREQLPKETWQNEMETSNAKGGGGRKGMEEGGLETRLDIESIWPPERKYRRQIKPYCMNRVLASWKALISDAGGTSTRPNARSSKIWQNRKTGDFSFILCHIFLFFLNHVCIVMWLDTSAEHILIFFCLISCMRWTNTSYILCQISDFFFN